MDENLGANDATRSHRSGRPYHCDGNDEIPFHDFHVFRNAQQKLY